MGENQPGRGLEKRSRLSLPRTFARRKGRAISARQRRLLKEELPKQQLDPSREYCGQTDFFQTYKDLRLEIGYGAGEHLLAQALRLPDTGFIGCEPYINGTAALLARMADCGRCAKNLRLFPDDARLLLPHLPEARFSLVYCLFPDPWHKARHQKRRLLSKETLRLIVPLLRFGGELLWASDSPPFIASGLAACWSNPELAGQGGHKPPSDWIETRYQRRAERLGHPVFFGKFFRTNPSPLAPRLISEQRIAASSRRS